MPSTKLMPSGLVVTTGDRATLVAIVDALAPTFPEPGPRLFGERDGRWRRMLLIPSQWCVRECGPVAPDVLEAAALAYAMGATEVSAMSFEMTVRPLRRLVSVSCSDPR